MAMQPALSLHDAAGISAGHRPNWDSGAPQVAWEIPNAWPWRAISRRSRNHATTNTAWNQQVNALLPFLVPRALRSLRSSPATLRLPKMPSGQVSALGSVGRVPGRGGCG
jgi:hypothetical protein